MPQPTPKEIEVIEQHVTDIENAVNIELPKKCPECNAPLEKIVDNGVKFLVCTNKDEDGKSLCTFKLNYVKKAWKKDLKERMEQCVNCNKYLTENCPKQKNQKLDLIQSVKIYENTIKEICVLFKYTANPNPTPEILEHLSQIENPNLMNKHVIVSGTISSNSLAYFVPKKIHSTQYDKRTDTKILSAKEIKITDSVNVAIIGAHIFQKQRLFKSILNTKNHVEEEGQRTIYQIRVRPPVFTLETRGEKLVDEKGYEYKPFDLFVISDEQQIIKPSTIAQFQGVILANPKTQKTTLLAYKVLFPESVNNFDLEKLKELKELFKTLNIKERFDWVVKNFEISAQLVDRRNIIKSTFLIYHTPLYVNFNGDIQRGWGNALHIGDTTCGKSHCQKKAIQKFKCGCLLTAETASSSGLLGTAQQSKGNNEWFVDLGFLPLQDRKLLSIDGAQKLSPSEWASLAEAERSGTVIIAKAAKSTSYARTRQIKISNAVDVENETNYSTKSISEFFYPIQSVATMLDKTSIARLDLAIVINESDVTPEAINKHFKNNYDERLNNYSEVLKWVWSNSVEVLFTPEAEKYLLEQSTKLYKKFFYENVPVVSIDFKWKLARLSTALAFISLSTDDFKNLIVTKEHIENIVEFIDQEYTKTGLNTLVEENRNEILEINDVIDLINEIIEKTKATITAKTVIKILQFVVSHGTVTKNGLMIQFELTDNNQYRPLNAILTNGKYLKTGRRGSYPTKKLIQICKLINSEEFKSVFNINFNDSENEIHKYDQLKIKIKEFKDKNPKKVVTQSIIQEFINDLEMETPIDRLNKMLLKDGVIGSLEADGGYFK